MTSRAGVAMRSAARTHVGLVRRINEDRVFDGAEAGVWAIADGMGGHRGGDVAAQSVVDALRALPAASFSEPAAILAALDRANRAIFDGNVAKGDHAGATIVALSVHGARMHLAWVGDSRCYRIRGGAVELLSHDHSLVQELVDAGLLTAEAAAGHPQANVITRALGVDRTCDVDVRWIDIAPGDRFLLCSDGLSRTLHDEDLAGGDLDALADDLMAAALARDGSDNISLVLIDI